MEKIIRVICGNVNCYIVASGKDAFLIDTARKKHRQKLLNACKPYNIRLIILTHGHLDHIQNAAFMAKALGAPIAMSCADTDLILDNIAQPMQYQGILGKILLLFSIREMRNGKIPRFIPDVALNDGDILNEYGIDAKIIALPGHTKGSIGIDICGKHLIVGDALMNMFYPSLPLIYNNRTTMMESTQKIRILGERTIYYGHGKPTVQPK